MEKAGTHIHKRAKNLFTSIKGDQVMFDRIVKDMFENAGKLSPISGWHFLSRQDELLPHEEQMKIAEKAYTPENYKALFSDSDKILDGWIGDNGKVPVTPESLKKWSPFLTKIDHLDLLPGYVSGKDQYDYKLTDMGSIMDLNLISGMLEAGGDKAPIHLLEIGGGYGRLTEAMMNVFPGQVKYVMLDAVPVSLMYAYLYLKQQLPHLRIGSFYKDDVYDMEQFDIYIMPTWHFERLNKKQFDVAVNIESLQEMNQGHVDHYLGLFDRAVKNDGLVYISNARDWLFKGQWNFPENWEILLTCNTPRSWSPDHPTNIFRKRKVSHKLKNAFLDAGYEYQLAKLKRANQKFSEAGGYLPQSVPAHIKAAIKRRVKKLAA